MGHCEYMRSVSDVRRWNSSVKHLYKDSTLDWHLSEFRSLEEAIFDEHSFGNSCSWGIIFTEGRGMTITWLRLFDWNGLKSTLTNNIVSLHSVSNMLNL